MSVLFKNKYYYLTLIIQYHIYWKEYDYEQNYDLETVHTMYSCKIKCTVPGDLKKKLILENVDI